MLSTSTESSSVTDSSKRTITLKTVSPPKVSPYSLRTLRICTYFVGGYDFLLKNGILLDPQSGIVDNYFCIGQTLASMSPYQVPMEAVRCILPNAKDYAISSSGCKDIDFVYDTLNVSIVGLCHSSNDERPLRCYGLGIIRSIDRLNNILFILSPVDMRVLQEHVDTLVRGNIQVPIE